MDLIEKVLRQNGQHVTEGHIRENQQKLFESLLKNYGHIQKVLEIGFNTGHSASMFLNKVTQLKSLISIDIAKYEYVEQIATAFQNSYPGIFHFLKGNSVLMLPLLKSYYPDLQFDLIFIDGSHYYQDAFLDILHAKHFSHSQTLIWIDDYENEVKLAVDRLEMLGYLKITNFFSVDEVDGSKRIWIEAQYM